MSPDVCPLCRSNQAMSFLNSRGVLDEKDYTLLQCEGCGLVKSEDIEGVVYSPEFNFQYPEAEQSLLRRIEYYYINMRWKREVKFLKRFLPSQGSLLDIGSGSGLFLKAMEETGFTLEGIDKNIDLKFNKKNQLKIHEVDIESDELPRKDYDCITLFHSLEHFKNPHQVLQKIRGVLKRNGLLLIQLPNIDSWQFRVFRGRWFHLFLPYHRFHFSRGTISRMLEQNGFSIIYVRHFSNRWNAEGWSASILDKNPVWFLKAKNEGRLTLFAEAIYFFITIFFIPIAMLEAFFKKGGIITVIARRND